ncbi:MAG: oxidoreductase C-terminal domain-containing protein, partial [Sciscionella sp.]
DNGILVDEYCRTSMPNVFAAGDIANQEHPLFDARIRVEHFDNANRQARAAADAILGRATSSRDPHWFWSDQYEANLQHTGHAAGTDQIVVRGSIEELDFAAFYLRQGQLRAAFGMDRGGDVMAAKKLISASASVDPTTLRDEDVDLMELTMSGEQV